MGKNAKQHRQKVAKRNEKINQAQKVYQKMYNEMLKQHIEAIKSEKMGPSGDTETPNQIIEQ
jgi:hypothetical protein